MYKRQAAVHADAASAAETDWDKIVVLYDALMAIRPSPVVALHPSVRIEEGRQNIGKAEPAITHAAFVFRIIPLEPDMGSVRQ